jgi:ABC-2 type transport system ATP-binding protein
MPRFAVQFQEVSKIYRRGLLRRTPLHALREVTFSVPRGSVFAVLGPNRAGKTTLLKALLGICRPTSGTILRLGLPAADRQTLARVGYVHERQAFPQYLTARTLLDYYGALAWVPRSELARRVPQLLDELGLADRAGEPIAAFSKGMFQRLALAQALVNDPELLVLDEPAEGMDLAARNLLDEAIRRHKNAGKTAILVSHNTADVGRLCDLAAVLREGRLAFTGSLAELAAGNCPDFPAATRSVGPKMGLSPLVDPLVDIDAAAAALQQALEPASAGEPA